MLFNALHIIFGDDAAAGKQYIVHSFLFHQGDHLWENGHVGAGKNADADGIHIFLQSSIDHHFGCLAETGIDHFHAGIPERRGNYLAPRSWPSNPTFATNTRMGLSLAKFFFSKIAIINGGIPVSSDSVYRVPGGLPENLLVQKK